MGIACFMAAWCAVLRTLRPRIGSVCQPEPHTALWDSSDTSIQPLRLDVEPGPEPGEHLRDHEVASLRALRRRADVPVRGDLVGRRAVIRQRRPAAGAAPRLEALELALEDDVELCGGDGSPGQEQFCGSECRVGGA